MRTWLLGAVRLGIFLAAFNCCKVACAEKVKPLDERQDGGAIVRLLSLQGANLNKIKQLSYKMRRDLVLGNNAGLFHTEYELIEGADGEFKCKWKQIASEGAELRQSVAFDGKNYQSINEESSTMFVKEGLPKVGLLNLNAEEFCLSPFWFAATKNEGKTPFNSPSLQVLGDPASVSSLLAGVRELEWVEKAGVNCCKFVLENQIGRDGDHVSRTVYLRATDGYPISWEDRNEAGKLMSRYWIQEIGYMKDRLGGFELPYPKLAKQEFFSQGTSDKPTVAYEYRITDCAINGEVEDSFNFEVGEIDRIYDETNKVLIPVPK
jgi:hypothetical protein